MCFSLHEVDFVGHAKDMHVACMQSRGSQCRTVQSDRLIVPPYERSSQGSTMQGNLKCLSYRRILMTIAPFLQVTGSMHVPNMT